MTGRLCRLNSRLAAVVGLTMLAAACALDGPSSATSSSMTTDADPSATIDWVGYVDGALARAEELYYRQDEVDWDEVRAAAAEGLGDDPTQQRAWRAIELALQVLHEPHTFFFRPEALQAREDAVSELPPPTGGIAADRIGLLDLPGTTGSGDTGRNYATDLHNLAVTASEAGVCGWVIDLRDNTGGGVVPMFLGLGPFLGDGVFFTTWGSNGRSEWSYTDRQLLVNGDAIDQSFWERGGTPADEVDQLMAAARLYTEPFVLSNPDQPIAVLTSFQTASAGEAVVIAFKGRDLTRFFGEPTFGVPTGNTPVYLDDGAVLVVTSSVMMDRNDIVYVGSIYPNEIVIGLPDTEADETLNRATDWLLSQATCFGG